MRSGVFGLPRRRILRCGADVRSRESLEKKVINSGGGRWRIVAVVRSSVVADVAERKSVVVARTKASNLLCLAMGHGGKCLLWRGDSHGRSFAALAIIGHG